MSKMRAFILVFFCYVCSAVAQRRQEPTPRPDGTEAPPTPRCGLDSFTIVRNCHVDCLVTDESTGCITSCNLACNRTRSIRPCPSLDDCTSLGCVRRINDQGCRTCQCEEPDDPDRRPDGEIDPCRVNATTFAVFQRCNLRCLVRRSADQCFMCNRTCNETAMTPEFRDECGVEDSDECPEGRVCLLEGVLNRCVRRPNNGEMCDRDDPRDLDDGDDDDDDDEFREELDEDDRDFFARVEGSADRLRAFSIQASAEIEPCADGFECRRSGDRQECTRITGPCINRTAVDAQVTCDEDGNFEPLQCRRMNDRTQTCRCVFPNNGSMVPGTMRTGITEREDAPDCVARVFRRCNYRQGNRNFTVRHGEVLVDRDTCMRCRCNDGATMDCERDPRVDCRRLNPGRSPQDCTRGAITVEHGTRMRVGRCNLCGCNNGRLTCTDIEECEDEGVEDDEQKSRCERCQDAPQRLVCGRDGRTYLSRCAAMNCSRLRDVDILDGPCSSQPVCRIHPCRSGYTCIPLGGRSCLRNEGCTADERRICVNRTALRCRISNRTRDGFNATEEDAVCGSDRRNYMSICHLIQQGPPNTRVAHSGSCDREECRSGPVCGTDGVTYNSTCHLRTHSANAQIDYRGECEDTSDGKNVQEICRRVREDRERCENTQETCQQRVMSRDGCCPVCGGITTLAIDRDALDEYSRATDSNANLDEFMARMTRDDVISDEVRRRCSVEVSHVRNTTETNIEVKMMAKDRRADAEFCHASSKDFADRINNGEDSTDETIVTTLPVEASFASAAVAAPLIADDGSSGAPGLLASCIAVLAAAIIAAIF